jgi:hypothetical protein
MGGLLVLAVFFAWLAGAIWLARRISCAIQMKPAYRTAASVGLTVLIFFLPVADELATRPWFEALCREHAVERIDVEGIRGRTVRLVVNPMSAPVRGALIPTFRSHFEYQDVNTGDAFGEYDAYVSKGGVLSQLLGFPGAHPLTGSFFCAPADEGSLPKRYGFVLVN